MRSAKLLLQRLTEIVPPGDGQRHNLTVDKDGDLILHLMLGDKFIPVKLTEDDFDKPVHLLVNEIVTRLF